MSDKQKTFVDLYLEGEVEASAIDDFIDQWHEGDSTAPIEEFLGFTPGEYALWVEKPWKLQSILSARKAGAKSA